jgi:hypothetical protein
MNDVAVVVVLVSATLVLICSLILVFHPEYEDGLIMRTGLALFGICAFSRVVRLLDGSPDYLNPVAILLWTGLALFLGGHTYRFLKRAMWKPSTWYPRIHSAGKYFRWKKQ